MESKTAYQIANIMNISLVQVYRHMDALRKKEFVIDPVRECFNGPVTHYEVKASRYILHRYCMLGGLPDEEDFIKLKKS